MSAPAPEREPTSLVPGAEAPPTNSVMAGQDWTALQIWWAGLTIGRRRQLLALTPTQALPQTIAADLDRRGVRCPLVLLSEGPRLVRRAVPSPVLLHFLAAQAS